MKKWTFLTLSILAFIGVLQAIDFETVFRDLSDPVEIVFVMDTTGSMSGTISAVRDNVIGFTEALEDSGYTYRLGATTFADTTNIWDFDPVTTGYNMTSDAAVFQAQVAVTGAAGGADGPEVQIDGIYDGAVSYDWTPGMLHVLFMFTDAPFHYPGDGTIFSDVTYDEMITYLLSRGFLLYIAYDSSYAASPPGIYDLLADTTGGCSFILGARRSPASWSEIFAGVQNDIMKYYTISTRITGLSGYTLQEIELQSLAEFTTFGPRIIDLSGPEYDGVDEINIAWTMRLTGEPSSSSPYTISLRTETEVFQNSGLLYYETPNGVSESATKPAVFSISIFPNPFNSSVRISVGARHAVPVQIEIYDIAGKKVFEAPVGEHLRVLPNDGKTHRSSPTETIWSPAPSVPSGVYLVRAKTGNSETTKRLVYIK